jgi:hypothetical protein
LCAPRSRADRLWSRSARSRVIIDNHVGECAHLPHVARLGIASIRQLRWQYGCVPEDIDRSLASIGIADFLRLAALAADAEAELFERNPRGSGRYAARLLGRALCQGAALHYVNGKNGVKDFDVWSFYAQCDDWPFPARWRGTRDFGPSKFGRYPGDPPRAWFPPGCRRFVFVESVRHAREPAACMFIHSSPATTTHGSAAPGLFRGFAGAGAGAVSRHDELDRTVIRAVRSSDAVHWSAAVGGGCLSDPFQGLLSRLRRIRSALLSGLVRRTRPGSASALGAVGTAVWGAPVNVLTGQAGRGWPLRELPASQQGSAAGRSGLRLPLPAIRRRQAA